MDLPWSMHPIGLYHGFINISMTKDNKKLFLKNPMLMNMNLHWTKFSLIALLFTLSAFFFLHLRHSSQFSPLCIFMANFMLINTIYYSLTITHMIVGVDLEELLQSSLYLICSFIYWSLLSSFLRFIKELTTGSDY